MNIVMERAEALAALSRVAGVIPRKTDTTILSHVHIRANDDGTATFRGTNLDMEATAEGRALVSETGETTVEAEPLLSILRNSPEGSDVMMRLEEPTRLNIKSGRSKFNLPTLPVSDLATFTAGDWTANFDIDAARLADMLDRTQFAAPSGRDSARAAFAGVHLNVAQDEMSAVTTNGHRMSWVVGPVPGGLPLDERGITIPHAMVDAMLGILEGRKGEVRIMASRSKVAIYAERNIVMSKLLDVKYPDFRRIAEGHLDRPGTMLVGRATLTAAINRAMAIAVKGARDVKLHIRGAGGLELTSRTAHGDAADEVAAEVTGTDAVLKFNADYLLDALAHIPGDIAKVRYGAKEESVLMSAPESDGDLILVMAQRV